MAAPPRAGDRTLRPAAAGGRFYFILAGVALVIGALSLLVPSTPSYDPWAWLVWGREITHLDLQLNGGPSWKPLPMIFTTIFAPFGRAQPDLWLVIARAGAVMAVAMVFKVAWRLTRDLVGRPEESAGLGRWLGYAGPLLAGLVAAGSLINSPGFISDNALGYSEGLATAFMLIAVDRFMDGHKRQAFVIGFFAALDRPELWIVWGAYGVYLYWKDPGARKLIIALLGGFIALWFLFPWWGSGDPLGGVTRALHPRSNSLAFAKCPLCSVLKKEAWPTLLNRVKIPAIIGLVAAAYGLWRTRARWWWRGPLDDYTRPRAWLLAIGLFGLLWWFGVALETQVGFSGNIRYLVLGTAPVAIAGGIAWGWFAGYGGRLIGRLASHAAALKRFATPAATRALGFVVAAALFFAIPPWIGTNIISIPRVHGSLVYQARLREDLEKAISNFGGAKRMLACGSVMTEGFQVPMVAWYLGVHTLRVEAPPNGFTAPRSLAPNTILQAQDTRSSALLPQPSMILNWEHQGVDYRTYQHIRSFRLFSTCPAKVGTA
jgi:hypothetical protein